MGRYVINIVTFVWVLFYLCSVECLGSCCRKLPVMMSNFNVEMSLANEHSPKRLEQPLALPIILTNPGEYKSNRPLFQKYSLRKYQLYDTNYLPDLSKITRLDQQLAYNMQPPAGVFEQSSKIVIQNYRLLEIKQFKIILINPSQRYRFCVQQIFIDSQEITRQEKRPLSLCLNPTTKYPFFFSLYVTEHKPLIFKGTIYFIINIYDGQQLVDEKIWPKEIIVKVTHNHLRIIPLEIRNCNKDNSIVMIRNPQKWNLSLVIIYKRKLYELTGEPIDGNIVIPAQKSYKFIIDGKDSKMTIYTKSVAVDITYPILYVPIYCIQDLVVDYFNIGILSDDRSLLQFPVTVSSYSNSTIYIQQISLKSSTETVQLLTLRQDQNNCQVQPNARHYIIGRIIIHGSRANMQTQKTYFQVSIKYMMQPQVNRNDTNKQGSQAVTPNKVSQQVQFQVRQTRTTYHYCEMRSPISVGNKRFIDISKLSDTTTSVSQNAFPIRNNLNLPINLIRVIYDESKFKLLWLQDRRDYIFPNHQRDEFSLQYIGPRNLQISPMKYVALLQFNGNLFIPLEVVVYDRTLQCVYYEQVSVEKPVKCSQLPTIQFGYFNQPPKNQQQLQQQQLTQQEQDDQNKQKGSGSERGRFIPNTQATTKVIKIAIRNWNPESRNVKVGIQQNSIQKYGFNTSVRVLGPYPQYEVLIKSQGNIHQLYLKGNHYIILEIQMTPLPNATSGTLPLRILTTEQHITKPIKFKVQNGTIALIPQISRFHSIYKKTIQYLNLVSTYKQPYRIKSIHSNLSNLMVYCNNYSEIYENQWIGMALIYEPFWGQSNITEECCGDRKGVERLFKQLKTAGTRPISVEITLKTSTQLQARAIVLIDRSSTPLIQVPYSHQFSIRQKFRKDAERIDIHLIDDGNMEKFEYKLKVKNTFDQTLKGNVLMFDEELIERLDQYMQYRLRMNEKVTAYFCLRNDVKVKHSFTPSLIKALFQLASLPLQVTVQPLTDTSFYINSPVPPREQVVQCTKFSEYFRQTINSGSRMCYRFQTSCYIKNLIQTGVINWFSEQHKYQVLVQFLRKQFQQLTQASQSHIQPVQQQRQITYLSSIKYNLHFEEFFSLHHIDKQHFCKGDRNRNKMTSLFKFCQHINIKMRYLESGDSKIYEREDEKTVLRLQQCLNGTVISDGKRLGKQCKKEAKEYARRVRKTLQKQNNRYFLLPSLQKVTADKKQIVEGKLARNQLEMGFEIYPIKNRAPTLIFPNGQHRATVQNPVLSKQPLHKQTKDNPPMSKPKKKPLSQQNQQQEQPLLLTSPSFYLVLLNNYTSYQLYHQTIQISKPKLKIRSVIINGERIQKYEFESNYFKDQFSDVQIVEGQVAKENKYKGLGRRGLISQRNRWLPVYIEESQITSKKQYKRNLPLNHVSQKHRIEPVAQGQSQRQFQMKPQQQPTEQPNVRQLLQNGDIDDLYVEGQKVFQIVNEGHADIAYTHIGFENQQHACVFKGVRVIAGPCTEEWTGVQKAALKQNDGNQILIEGQNVQNHKLEQKRQNQNVHMVSYKLPAKSGSLIKIRYGIPLSQLISQKYKKPLESSQSHSPNVIKSPPLRVYLYNSNSYYIELIIKFKFSSQLQSKLRKIERRDLSEGERQHLLVTKIWNIVLNIMAVVFICGTIVKFREDQQLVRLRRSSLQFGSQLDSSKFPYPTPSSNTSYQKAYRRLKSKNEFLNNQQLSPLRQNGLPDYQIIQPSFYPFTIGTLIPATTKNNNIYHPVVTISQEMLNLIRQEQKKQSKLLGNYFNESEESQIMTKNQHQVVENISLTINLDQEQEYQNQNNRQNESISEESSFDFEIRNSSRSHQQEIRKQDDCRSNAQVQSSGSGSDFSQASQSQLPDGQEVQVTDQILNLSDEGFGFESQSKKKPHANSPQNNHEDQKKQVKKQGYYNVFFTQNPLKKGKQQLNSANSPFSWMNQNKKRSKPKW